MVFFKIEAVGNGNVVTWGAFTNPHKNQKNMKNVS